MLVYEKPVGRVTRLLGFIDLRELLAVQHIWGAPCYWSWLPGSDSDGRVYERLGEAPDAEDIPRTGTCTVQIKPAQRRPRVS